MPNYGRPRKRAGGHWRRYSALSLSALTLFLRAQRASKGLSSSRRSPERGKGWSFSFGSPFPEKARKSWNRERPQSGPETSPLPVGQTWLLRGCASGRNQEAKRHSVQECVRTVSSLGAVLTSAGSLGASLRSGDQRQRRRASSDS